MEKTNNIGHKVLREEGQFLLCVDNSTGTPTYYIENDILTRYTKGYGRSYNFEEEKKSELMTLSRTDFVTKAKQRAGNDINSKEVAKGLWDELGDIPVTEDDDLDANFTTHSGTIFEIGTDKFDVWHWFEETFNVSVAKDLMGLD